MKRVIITMETNRIMGVLSSAGTIQMTTEEIASIFQVTVASRKPRFGCPLRPG